MIAWDWQWQFEGWMFVLTVDVFDWMVGIAIGPRDLIVKPIPCVVLQFEWLSE